MSLDTTTRTSTPHVVDLVIRNGLMLAVCRCGTVLLRVPAQLPQAERAERLQDAIRSHLFRAAVLLFCCVLWSSVMSEPAYSVSQLSRMSDAQWRAFMTGESMPARKQITAHIEIDDIPNAAQAALVSMSFDFVAKAVTDRLKQSTVRFGAREFTLLRELGLAERKPDTIYHRLTDDGKGYARTIARRIAKEIGLHVIWTEIVSFKHENAHCSCEWRRSLHSGQQCQRERHYESIQQHLAEAAGAPKRQVPREALDKALGACAAMMGHKGKMKGGDEYSALTRWRRFMHWRSGARAWIKNKFNRRMRREIDSECCMGLTYEQCRRVPLRDCLYTQDQHS